VAALDHASCGFRRRSSAGRRSRINMSTVHDYYQRYWSEGGFAPTGHHADWKLTEMFERVVTPDRDALDVGCGDGSKSGTWLSAHALSYVGVDVSQPAIELARAGGLDARVINDASELPFADGSFDVVVISEVLEHLFDPLGAAREVRRVLRANGDLLVTVPNVAHWRVRADMAILGRWHPGGDEGACRWSGESGMARTSWGRGNGHFYTSRRRCSGRTCLLTHAGPEPRGIGPRGGSHELSAVGLGRR
jgi:SAM-dependent methyltransferase